MTLRAVLLGLVLLPVQAFWIIHMELVRGGIWPTVLTLLFTVVFFLFCLGLANLGLRRWLPKLALRDEELTAVYILLATGASLCGCDVGQTLVHILGAPYHFATDSNGWADHFGRYLPASLLVSHEPTLRDFYRGSSTLYTWSHLRYWLGPLLSWLGFIAGMLTAMYGLCRMVQRQWVEHERLTFPIVQVPLAMTTAGFYRSRTLWLGFALAGGLDLLNGLHALVPAAPQLNTKQVLQMGSWFTSPPWNAVGWLPLTLYPFAIGLGFLMPAEMSFSCWVGFGLWKLERVLGAWLGYPPTGNYGGILAQEQLAGIWLAVVLSALWSGRGELRRLLRPEADHPSLRPALLLVLLGLAEMVACGLRAGMTGGFALVYMVGYLAFSLALTRVRAEFGPPCHDFYQAGPDAVLLRWLGPGAIRPRNLTALAVFYWLARESPRSHPMPHQLEALYLGSARLRGRRLGPVIVLAGCLSAVVTYWATLHYAHVHGSEGGFHGPATWFATEGFKRLDQYLLNPQPPDPGARLAMVAALLASLGLLQLRSRLLWFTFHPAGYAIASWWAIHLLWFPLFLAWALKGMVLRYGGGRAYRAWRPFFFGLILGEFVVGSLWQLAALAGGFTAYAFWI